MNPLRRILRSISLLSAAASLAAFGGAQTQSYVTKAKNIRAAVVILDADKSNVPGALGQTAAPFAFYNLDRAQGVKPGGWNFVNPYAPGQTTAETIARYSGFAGPSTTGLAIDKSKAAYWSVRLATLNDNQISDYDVLLISSPFNLSLNPTERERLRKFVDGGGVLWVDLSTGVVDLPNNLPAAIGLGTATGNQYRDISSPLLSGLRRVTDQDLNLLNGSGGTNVVLKDPTTAGTFPGNFLTASLTGEWGRYGWVSTISGSGFGPTIAEARIGAGAIVVTSRGVARLLNQTTASQANNLYTATKPVLTPVGRAAARFAVNLVALGNGFDQPSSGSRKTNADAAEPGSPVLTRFKIEGAHGPGNVITGLPNGAPVTYKGFVIATIGNRVVVYDALPNRDLDGDGDSDDGIYDGAGNVVNGWRDTSVGMPLDLVWYSAPVGSGVLSPPVVASVPEATNRDLTDQVLVTDSAGTLHVFKLRYLVNGFLAGGQQAEYTSVQPPNGTAAVYETNPDTGNLRVNPPTVEGGIAYMADATSLGTPPLASPSGRVWLVDLANDQPLQSNGSNRWFVGTTGLGGTPLPAATAEATVGSIPIQDGSGGVDRVVYVPGVAGQNTQPGFVSLWFGAKGERPYDVNIDDLTSTVRITTRAGANGNLPLYWGTGGTRVQQSLAVKVTLMDANGDPLTGGTYDQYVSGVPSDGGPGVIVFNTSKTKAQWDADKVTVRVDYTIDWGTNAAAGTGPGGIERGRLLLPVPKGLSPVSSRRILGPIALTSRGTLHLVEGDRSPTTPTGSYFAMREDAGRGQFHVVARYSVYSQYNQSFAAAGQSTTVPPVLEDVDWIRSQLPAFINNQQLSNFRFAGGVAVRNGLAYALINANRGVMPVVMLAAFKAEPDVAELRLGTNMGTNPRLAQADFARTPVGGTIVNSTISGDRLTVDADNGIVRLENLATVTRGEITDCISLSQPVGVASDVRAYNLRQPEKFGDRWTPLQWFGLWNGGTAHAAPLVAGSEVFVPADSMLPNLLASNFTNFTSRGVIWSVDADVPTTGTFATTLPGRDWITQATQITVNPSFQVSPYYRMPQNRGVGSFTDWLVRLEQTAQGSSTKLLGLSSGDAGVFAWGDQGLYGLSRGDFIVADEGRLLRVDSSGNAVSNIFGGLFAGIGNGSTAAEHRPLVRPVRAYPVGSEDYLVVDAGANRVVRMDDDGSEIRTIESFQTDPTYKPVGWKANESVQLNDPQDALTYEGYVRKTGNEVVTNQQPVEYWVHYVIADAGNGRVIELVDRYQVDSTYGVGAPIELPIYDPALGTNRNVAQVGVVVWKSPSLEEHGKIGDYYHSISRVFVGTATQGRYVYVAGVGRTRPTRSTLGLDTPNSDIRPSATGGGAIVVFDPLGGTRVFDRFGLKDLSGTRFYDSNTGTFTTNTPASRPAQNDRPFVNLKGLSTATTISGNEAAVRVMATDADAVYEFILTSAILADPTKDPTKDASQTNSLTPLWFINEAAFTSMRGPSSNPKYFRPTFARRLDSGDVLIVNGYSGVKWDGSPYSGEVVLLSGGLDTAPGNPNNGLFAVGKDNLGFFTGSVQFELPPLTGIRGLVHPVFADRR